jgi:hypothetical protein
LFRLRGKAERIQSSLKDCSCGNLSAAFELFTAVFEVLSRLGFQNLNHHQLVRQGDYYMNDVWHLSWQKLWH